MCAANNISSQVADMAKSFGGGEPPCNTLIFLCRDRACARHAVIQAEISAEPQHADGDCQTYHKDMCSGDSIRRSKPRTFQSFSHRRLVNLRMPTLSLMTKVCVDDIVWC